MRAIALFPEGRLDWVEVPKPEAQGHDLLVRVKAVAVNPVDVKQSPGSEPRILGYDVAGVVEAVGSEVTLFQPGDEVYYAGSIVRPGGFSEYHLVDERIVGPKPRPLSFAEAAAMPLTTITAWEGLFDRMRVPLHDAQGHILIIGAAGGVGSIAIQLARMAGLQVIATASRPESRRWVEARGAHHVISHAEPLEPQVTALGLERVEYIFCLTSVAPYWDAMMALLAPEGQVCLVLPPGNVALGPLWALSGSLHAESMFVRPRFQTPTMIQQHRLLSRVATLIDQGVLHTTLSEQFAPISPETLSMVFERIRQGHVVGKLAISGFDS
ncbi:MAG: zinc-binding alcohol dehydrogenase family protein [Firmicutes bacterium]|nr:zinc-binding alcohol dehydrogenase family protein [Bacillota bacterium]